MHKYKVCTNICIHQIRKKARFLTFTLKVKCGTATHLYICREFSNDNFIIFDVLEKKKCIYILVVMIISSNLHMSTQKFQLSQNISGRQNLTSIHTIVIQIYILISKSLKNRLSHSSDSILQISTHNF